MSLGPHKTAVNAPIKKPGPSGRTNTCLLIALTFVLWEQGYNAKQMTNSLKTFPWSLIKVKDPDTDPGISATHSIKVKTALTILPLEPGIPEVPLGPCGPCENKNRKIKPKIGDANKTMQSNEVFTTGSNLPALFFMHWSNSV